MAAQKPQLSGSLGRCKKHGDGRVRFQFTSRGLIHIPPFPPSKSSAAGPKMTMSFPLRSTKNGVGPCPNPSDALGDAPKNVIFRHGTTGSTVMAEQTAIFHPPPVTGTDPTSQEILRAPHRQTTLVPAPHSPVLLLQSPHLSSHKHATPWYQQEFEAGATSESMMSTPQQVFSSFCNERTRMGARVTLTPVSTSSLGVADINLGADASLSPGKAEPSLAYHAMKRQSLDSSSGGGRIQIEKDLQLSPLSPIAALAAMRTGAVEVDDADQAARQEKKRSLTSFSAFTISLPPGTDDSLFLQLPKRFKVNKIAPEEREENNKTPSPIQPQAEHSVAVEATAFAAFVASLHEVPRLARMGEKEFLTSPVIINPSRPERHV